MKTSRNLKARQWLSQVSTSVLILLAVSCQKSDQFLNKDTTANSSRVEASIPVQEIPLADDYQVHEGILHFKDVDAFVRIHKVLAKMSHDERLKFAQTAGFKSLLAYQDEFVKACEAAEVTKEETVYRGVLAKYADIISLDTLDNSKVVDFKVKSPLLASYQDRTGVLYIGKVLYRFGDFDQTIVLDGNRSNLNAPESSVVKHISHRPDAGRGGRVATSTCKFINDRVVFGSCGDRHSRLSVVAQYNYIVQGNN